jgi:hypothetical protein
MEVMKNPFCKPRKMSFPRIIEQFETIYIFLFILSSLNYSIDKFRVFLYQDKKETGGTKANEREGETQASKRSKLSRPMLSTLLQPRPQPSGAVSKVLVELNDYHKEPHVTNEAGEFVLSFSPIQYWKMNNYRFSALAPIPSDVMGVPASSANIERAFSTAVDLKSAKRNKIKSALFHMLLH